MHPKTQRLALAAALVMAVTLAACDNVPFLPQWSTDLYVPLGASTVGDAALTGGAVIPPNSGTAVPGEIRRLPMDGTAADILSEALDEAAPILRLEVRVTKTGNLTVTLSDTIYLAGSDAELATSTVLTGFTMGPGETSLVDTLQLGANGIALIRQLVEAQDTLHLQARGRIQNGPSAITVQTADSIHVKVGALVRVPVAGGS